jgi:hypothetical protein
MNLSDIPIDWASVNWLYFGLLVAVVFVTSLVGSLISFRRSVLGALISGVLFAGVFLFWTYYPHHLPLPSSPVRTVAAPITPTTPTLPAAPTAPTRPANPVREIAPR